MIYVDAIYMDARLRLTIGVYHMYGGVCGECTCTCVCVCVCVCVSVCLCVYVRISYGSVFSSYSAASRVRQRHYVLVRLGRFWALYSEISLRDRERERGGGGGGFIYNQQVTEGR